MDKQGMDKDDQVFVCDRCCQNFGIDEMIPEDDLCYCKECYNKLLEQGEA